MVKSILKLSVVNETGQRRRPVKDYTTLELFAGLLSRNEEILSIFEYLPPERLVITHRLF